ncbi:hypothetical protein BH11PLA2_BH11PLA2_48800 [soil metagenome]
MAAVMALLSDPDRPGPGDAGFALWAARLVFLVEDEIARVVGEEREQLLRTSAN